MLVEHTAETTLLPDAIWRVWQKADEWPLWDEGAAEFSLKGPFQSNTKGIMKLKNGLVLAVELVDVHSSERFSLRAHRLGLTILITGRLTRSEEKTYVTHSFEAKGLLAPLLQVFTKEMKQALSRELNTLIYIAQAHNPPGNVS